MTLPVTSGRTAHTAGIGVHCSGAAENWWDVRGWTRYAVEWAHYVICFSGR